MATDAIGEQLAAELATVFDQLNTVFGMSLLISDTEPFTRTAAAVLTSDHPTAATVADKLIPVLAPRPTPEWWATPLGHACAAQLTAEHNWPMTYAAAAHVLNVHPGTVARLGHRGTIARHPAGGLVPADVIHYKNTRKTRST